MLTMRLRYFWNSVKTIYEEFCFAFSIFRYFRNFDELCQNLNIKITENTSNKCFDNSSTYTFSISYTLVLLCFETIRYVFIHFCIIIIYFSKQIING